MCVCVKKNLWDNYSVLIGNCSLKLETGNPEEDMNNPTNIHNSLENKKKKVESIGS